MWAVGSKAMRAGLACFLGLALASGLACSSTLESFTCSERSDCRSESGGEGFCEDSNLCSFADDECASGRRYGSLAGESSNRCVQGRAEDSGIDDTVIDAGGSSPVDADLGDADIVDAAVGTNIDAGFVCPISAAPGVLSCPLAVCENGDVNCCRYSIADSDNDISCNDVCESDGGNCEFAAETDITAPCVALSSRACGNKTAPLFCYCTY